MTCRTPEEGRFRDVSLLPEAIRDAAFAVHGTRSKPGIYDISFSSGMASLCVHRGKVYSMCLTGAISDDLGTLQVNVDPYKSLYFVLMQLQSRCELESVQELCPFIDDYDLIKLIQNRQYHIVKEYLRTARVQEIPPAVMQESLLIQLFVEAGWTLSLDILIQYYDMLFYKLYLTSVRSILKRGTFPQDERYAEAKNRFLDFSLARCEDDIYELVCSLP